MDFNSAVKHVGDLVEAATSIVIIQADNPDADSLASALALEHILGDKGKAVSLYCGVDIPGYLRYFPGYDRVSRELPKTFDLAIMVDCSSITLLEQLEKTKQITKLGRQPFIVIDHHTSEVDLPVEHVLLANDKAVATGEVIYELAQARGWQINKEAAEFLASSILADSLGLTTEAVTGRAIHILGELVDQGVSLAEIDARRRTTMIKPLPIIAYKAKLLERISYYCDDQLAVVVIPWKEIEQYSPLYNPGVLALEELRLADKVKIAIALKTYPDGKITGKLRCNFGCKIANDLAGHFGGGGHPAAAGFKTFGWDQNDLLAEIIKQAQLLLDKEQASATI